MRELFKFLIRMPIGLKVKSRKTVFLTWLFGGVLISVLISIATLLYQQAQFPDIHNYRNEPIDFLGDVLIMMPFGWMISIVLPWGGL